MRDTSRVQSESASTFQLKNWKDEASALGVGICEGTLDELEFSLPQNSQSESAEAQVGHLMLQLGS